MKPAFALVIVLSAVAVADAAGPTWSEWEHKHAVAHEGQFLVIHQPGEAFCYLKQSYEDDTGKMELSMKRDGVPYLVTPFFRGIEGDISYHVNDGPVRIVPENPKNNMGFNLSTDAVPEMKRGGMLSIRVKPTGEATREQRFELRGFSAAAQWLDKPTCREKDKSR